MEARTFTPRPRKMKAIPKIRHVPIPGPTTTETTIIGHQTPEEEGWSLVTRDPLQKRPSEKQCKRHTSLSSTSLSHTSSGPLSSKAADKDPCNTLAYLRSALARSNRRALFREEFLQHLCKLTPSKPASGLVDLVSASISSHQQSLLQKNAQITGTTLLLDAYSAVASTSNSSSPRPRAPQDPLAQLHARRTKITQAWRASPARGRLLTRLRRVLEHACPESKAIGRIDCVCLGLGSLSAEATGWKSVSMWQLAIWEDVCSSLFGAAPSSASSSGVRSETETATAGNTMETRLVFQDPMFNERDITFLAQELGYHVVDSPAGYDILDPLPGKAASQQQETQSAVFAPHFPVRFWPQGVRLGKPLFVIGNGVGDAGNEALLDKIPGRKVVGRAVAMIERLDEERLKRPSQEDSLKEDEETIGDQDQDTEEVMSYDYEAEIMRKEIWAREEMELFLRRWTNVKCPTPDECREALWETVVWSPRSQEEDDDP